LAAATELDHQHKLLLCDAHFTSLRIMAAGGDQLLGTDPETGREVRLKMGPYGPYLQLAAPGDASEKARNVALPPSAATSGISLSVRRLLKHQALACQGYIPFAKQLGSSITTQLHICTVMTTMFICISNASECMLSEPTLTCCTVGGIAISAGPPHRAAPRGRAARHPGGGQVWAVHQARHHLRHTAKGHTILRDRLLCQLIVLSRYVQCLLLRRLHIEAEMPRRMVCVQLSRQHPAHICRV
jgi:Topoisomerase C-terminal repeat